MQCASAADGGNGGPGYAISVEERRAESQSTRHASPPTPARGSPVKAFSAARRAAPRFDRASLARAAAASSSSSVVLAATLFTTVISRMTLSALTVCSAAALVGFFDRSRSEEHTSELQSLMRISSAVFCLKKNKK